jgi:predicted CXXCH cytochrome family protein
MLHTNNIPLQRKTGTGCDVYIKVDFCMRIKRPVTQLPMNAAPGFWMGLRAFSILILIAGFFGAAALAAPAPRKEPAKPAQAAADSSQFVGSETCATCHEEVSKGFANNPHTKMSLMHGKTGVTCENCHGAGKAHVDGGGDTSKIFNPAKHSTKEVDEKCLSCHAGTHPNFLRSPHAKAGVGCMSCHTVHGADADKQPLKASLDNKLLAGTTAARSSEDKDKLLKAPQPQLCYSCHADQKAQFNMPMHHKVNEGLVKCSDCHDTHGTFGANNVKSTEDQNAVCTKCHTDVRGPFVFEHTPVKSEGCVACHTPHGSQNARLLNMPTIATLCNQCHSPVGAGTVHGQGTGSSSATPCINCHTFIHGSNASQAFIR